MKRIKSDGSVHINGHGSGDSCNGDCRDDCECYRYCECRQCQLCTSCDHPLDDCECEECKHCIVCSHQIDDCNCTIGKSEECENPDCEDGNVCKHCKQEFIDNREVSIDCAEVYNNCDFTECNCACNCDCDCSDSEDNLIGEIASKPMKPNKIKTWMTINYPQKTNTTCGLHVHVSFKSKLDYMRLMNPEFNTYLIKRLTTFGNVHKINKESAFWKRLNNHNTYCNASFIPEDQKFDPDNRYTQINFGSYQKHKTIEFRLLPCFQTRKLGIYAVLELVKIVNDFVNANSKPEKGYRVIIK